MMNTNNIIWRLLVWVAVIALVLLVPFLAMRFQIPTYDPGSGYEQVNWTLSDFVLMGAALFGIGLVYELIGRRLGRSVYRFAFAVGLLGAFMLFWINGAVGIIGNEDNPANLMYGAVFLVGLLGSIVSRFKSRGMAYTLFSAAVVQILVPLFALFVWPANAHWGEAGVVGVFILNAGFSMVFAFSGALFLKAADAADAGSDLT